MKVGLAEQAKPKITIKDACNELAGDRRDLTTFVNAGAVEASSMAKNKHSLGFQALNQARSATHAQNYFEGYLGLVGKSPDLGEAFHAYGDLFSVARKAMRDMAIINTASVMDRQENSTGMLRLINDVRGERPDVAELCKHLIKQLDAHRPTFIKTTQIRSNVIAHRSKYLSYKEVHDNASLADFELGNAIAAWRSVAQAFSINLRGEPWSVVSDPGGAARLLLSDIAAGVFPKSGK